MASLESKRNDSDEEMDPERVSIFHSDSELLIIE